MARSLYDYMKGLEQGKSHESAISGKNNTTSGKRSLYDYMNERQGETQTESGGAVNNPLQNNSILTRANSWLKSSSDYFGAKDEFNTEYFESRGKRANELSVEGGSILEDMRKSYGEDSESYKEFSGYYDEILSALGQSTEYYKQNPYIVKHYDSDIGALKASLKNSGSFADKLLRGDIAAAAEIRKENKALLELKRYKESEYFSGLRVNLHQDPDAEMCIEVGKKYLDEEKLEKLSDKDREIAYYLEGKKVFKWDNTIDVDDFLAWAPTDYDSDGKNTIKDFTKYQKDMAPEKQRFVWDNIDIGKDEIYLSEEYSIGDSYIEAIQNNSLMNFEIPNIEEEEMQIVKYLVGKQLKDKGYDAWSASDVESSEYLANLPDSEDWKVVDDYLNTFLEEREFRQAQKDFERIKGKPIAEIATKINMGITSNPKGIIGALAFGKDLTGYTRDDYLNQMIDEDLENVGPNLPQEIGGRSIGQAIGDAAQNLGHMAPSMALSAIPYVGGALSSVSFGLSSGGNAKIELMREGYDEETSTKVGVFVGFAEATLEKLLGGVPGLSSSAGNGITSGIKSAVLRGFANYGVSIVKETIEESAQEALMPVWKYLGGINPEEIEAVNWEEVAYAGLQGAMMAGTSNTVTMGSGIAEGSGSYFESPTADDYVAVEKMIVKGLESDTNTDFYKEASRINKKMQKAYDIAVEKGKSAENAGVDAVKGLSKNDMSRLFSAMQKHTKTEHEGAIKSRLKELGYEGNSDVEASAIYKMGNNQSGELTVREAFNKSDNVSKRVRNEYKNRGNHGYSSAWAENIGGKAHESKTKANNAEEAKPEVEKVSADDAAVSKEYRKGIPAKRLSDSKVVGVVGVEYSDGNGEVTYRLNNGEVSEAENIELDDDFESYIVKTAPQMYQTDSANAMIKASVEYRTFAGYEASSSKFQSSFEDLRNAGLRGMTFEQAKNDIRLSGDVGQIGERAARIAINDGLSQNHKKAKPVTGTVRIAEDVKKTSAIKENMPILKHIARSGDVAIVIEHFSGADRESKGFYTRGVIHLNADKLSEGGYTYTGIHECVHYVAEVNAEGYKAIEKFVENYYKKKGVDIEAEKKATQALYEQRGVKLTSEEAMEEIVCNTLSDIATDADALTAFMGLDSKSRNKFIDALKTLARKLKVWAKTHLAGTKYHDAVIKDADTLLSLAKQLNAELAKAGQMNVDAFTMEKQIEETHDLLAMHNINAEQLAAAFKHGGLIAPSFAVTNKGLDVFGEISLIFEKSTIDPNVDATNKLYGADAWTPQQNNIKKNAKFDSEKTAEVVAGIKENIGESVAQEIFDVSTEEFQSEVIRNDGSVIDAYSNNIGMQTAFARQQGAIDAIPMDNGKVDIKALKKMLDGFFDKDASWRMYRRWMNSISDSVITSFDEATSSELLKKMNEQPDSAKPFRLTTDGKLIVPAVRYDSIDTLRKNKSRLSETADAEADVVANEMLLWADKVGYEADVSRETIVGAINNAYNSRYDVRGIVESFNADNITLSQEQATILQNLYKKAVELPTRYFEAKSHREVNLSEVAHAVIPSNTSEYIRSQLEEYGIMYSVYEAGNEQARLDEVNSLNDYKFSISVSERFDSTLGDMRYSFSDENMRKSMPKVERLYYEALENEDMDSADMLVNMVASRAMKDSKIRNEVGLLEKVYHGTEAESFNEFDKQRRGQTDSSMYGRGYYFAFDPDYASDFGDNIREFYLDIKNPYYIDINAPASNIADFLISNGIEVDFDYSNMISHYFAKNFGSQKFTDTLIDLGYDGVVVRTDEGENFEAVAFHRNQMKLADVVTYDDQGEAIPLAERFNMQTRDVRYSFGEEDLDFGLYISEGSGVSESLKDSGRAVGAMLEKTRGAEVDIYDISRVMKNNLKDFGIKGETISANERILEVINLASADSYVDGDGVMGEIAAVMKDTLRNSPYVVDNFKEEREDILSRMKGFGKIYLTEDQIAMLEDSDYSLNWFKQKMFGKVTVVTKPKTASNVESLNTLWHSLSEAYPMWFSSDTLSDNMPLEMIKALESLKPQSVGAEEFFMQSNDETAIELAGKVLSDIIDLKYKKLGDSSLRAEVKKLKEKQSDSMKKWLLKKDAGEKLKSIERYAAGFYKKLIKPSKNDSIPEVLRKPMLEMLEGLNFSKGTLFNGEAIKHDKIWQVRMKVVAEALMNYGGLTQNPDTKDITLEGNAVRGFEVDARLVADLNELAESSAKDVYKMSDEELIKLNNLMYRLRNEVSQLNKLNANTFKAHVQDLGQATISELDNKGENKLLKSKANNVLFYSTADALTYFSQYGEAGMSVYEELREGYDKYILNIDKVRRFSEKNLDEKKIRQWSKESHDFTLKSGDMVTMTTPQLMTLYLLNKRKQARGHLYENPDKRGEIAVVDSKRDKSYGIVENDDIVLMTAKLTDEQIKCAERMQSFLENEVAEWGNEITMRRYLYRAFTVKDYFPIKVDGVSIDTTDATASMASFYAVANPGFSKQTQEGAHKPLIIGDVFDVFTEHCGNMAMFNGMSEALSDAMRWYNFRSGKSSVKKSIETTLSKEGMEWFETFIQDLNGRGQKAKGADKVVKKMVATTKSALIWGNMKVVAQQPTAYLRALNVLDIKYLADPRVLKKGGVEKAMKYCPTAMYKSWGFYTTDVGKSARNLVINTDTVYDKVKNFGFKAAGFADEITWGRLWNACELQVKDTNKNLKVGSEEFYQEVAKLLRRVIDETQVVDTPFHRSQIRRNPSATSQIMSAFMDEPIKSYNMFMRAAQSGDGKKFARAAVSYIVTVTLGQSLVKAVYDLLIRYKPDEDDDDKRGWDDFLELYGKSVVEEINPLNLHPILSKFSGIGETILHNVFPDSPLFSNSSLGSGSLDSTAITDLTNMIGRIIKGIKGENEDRTWYGYAYDISKVISDVSGIGVSRVLQDVVGIVNNFLPADAKVTKTDYSNSAIAEMAVDSLLNGNKGDYEAWYKELEERFNGDKDKIQSQLASALGKSNDKRVSKMLEAMEKGDKKTFDSMYDELVGLGFERDVVMKGTKSYKAKYNGYVKKAAQANIDGDTDAYDEAIAWIKEQEVFDDEYESDIAEKEEQLRQEQSTDDVEELYDNTVMIKALKDYGKAYYDEILEERLEGKSDAEKEQTRKSLKTAVSKEFKLSFCEAFCNENAEEVEKIEGYLISSGLYADDSDSLWEDTTKDWVKIYIRDAYKSAYSLEDDKECTRLIKLLYKSGVYANKKNADKALESWRNEEK